MGRAPLVAIVLVLVLVVATRAAVAQTEIQIPAPRPDAPTVPLTFAGMNLTSNKNGLVSDGFAPCCLDDGQGSALGIQAWRIPGGSFSQRWHWLDGDDGCTWSGSGSSVTCSAQSDDPNATVQGTCGPTGTQSGPTFDQFVTAIESVNGTPIVTLNWEATDQELANLVEYATGTAPPASQTQGFTTTSYAEDARAPAGYFAWLRDQRLPQHGPITVAYWELGNEIYGAWECDPQTQNDPTLYGKLAAKRLAELHAVSANSKICVIDWEQGSDRLSTELAALGTVAPDCVVEHSYPLSTPTPGSAAATAIMNEPATRADIAASVRATLVDHYGAAASSIELIMTEFGTSTQATLWETSNMWGAIDQARTYAELLANGWSNVDNWIFTEGNDGFSAVDSLPAGSAAPFTSTYFATQLFGEFARGGETLLGSDGGAGAIHSYAVRADDGTTRVLLVDQDFTTTADIDLVFADVITADVTRYHYGTALGGADETGNSTTRFSAANAPKNTSEHLTGGHLAETLEPLSIDLLVITPPATLDGAATDANSANDAPGSGSADAGAAPAATGSGCGCGADADGGGWGLAMLGLAALRRRGRRRGYV